MFDWNEKADHICTYQTEKVESLLLRKPKFSDPKRNHEKTPIQKQNKTK